MPFPSYKAVAGAFWLLATLPALAQDPPAPGTRVEFTNRLTPEQRDFIRNVPELQYARRSISKAILAKQAYWGEFDLDGDGVPERIVALEHDELCDGYSCTTVIFKREPQGWLFASQIDADHKSLRVLLQSNFGWRLLSGKDGQTYARRLFFYEEAGDSRQEIAMLNLAIALDGALFERPGSIVQFRNQLTAGERSFVRTSPFPQWRSRLASEALLRRNIFWADVDLNDDGVPERLIMIEHTETCGSKGCSLTIFRLNGGRWVRFADITGRRQVLSILPESDFGWRRIDNGPDDINYMRRCGIYFAVDIYDDDTPADWDPCPGN